MLECSFEGLWRVSQTETRFQSGSRLTSSVSAEHDLALVSTAWEDKQYWVNIRKALTCGFFMQVAHKEGDKGAYNTIKDNQVSSFIVST